MLDLKLSIVIPCYNCVETLAEAVASIYIQNLTCSFEIVLVDDGSVDGTRDLMTGLSEKYKEIKCFFHEKNKGGGATRNTAIHNSQGDIIFCLDSDDMLAEGTLAKMVAFIEEKGCDGVGISKSIKFNGKDINDVAFVNDFGYVGELIPFESLFDNSLCPLYSTFLHTKKAFSLMGGYPEDHGFDTQGLAWRFLASGLSAYTCPDAVYLHRINFHESYYLREYNSGRANYNYLKILEEFLFLFSNETKEKILGFDFNNPVKNLSSVIPVGSEKFCQDYRNKITNHTKEKEKEVLLRGQKIPDCYDYYWLGNEFMKKSDFGQAVKYLEMSGLASRFWLVKKRLVMCKQALELGYSYLEAEKEFIKVNIRPRNSILSVLRRGVNKLLVKFKVG